MRFKRTCCLSVVMMMAVLPSFAGGILTNTNQSIQFLRNPARDGVIAIDGAYSNPAGVAFLPKGFHLSIANQSAFQTRTIRSGMSVEGLENTHYYQPFKLNGGDENGVKRFKGDAAAPVLPSVQAALNYDKWGFQINAGLIGGGGKATFSHGLGSFERQVAMLPAILQQANQTYKAKYGVDLGLGSDTPGYSVESYIHGQQYVFGVQFGATYKFNEHWAAYGGFRFNYIYNKYKGNITNIMVNIGGNNVNLYERLGATSSALSQQAVDYKQQSDALSLLAEQARLNGNDDAAAIYASGAAQAAAGAKVAANGAQTIDGVKEQVADKYLDCTQRGWSIDPIIGIDFRQGPLNIGARLEFTTHFNIENDTKRDDTGLFTDGVNTPGDMPGILTVGAQYEIMPQWRVMGGFHYYFDKDARMDKDKQTKLSRNTWEYNMGTEYDFSNNLGVSAGMQKTSYGLGNGAFLSDMSFVVNSYSVGLGGWFRVSKRMKVNIAYFWTNYETFHKEYDSEMVLAGQTITTHNTDDFTRTNKVFGAGVEIDF